MSTLTIGYSDSEDRLWLRIIDKDSNEGRIWLTRGMTQNLINEFARQLEFDAPDINVLDKIEPKLRLQVDLSVSKETFENVSPPPPSKSLEVIQVDGGLCVAVNFSKNTSGIWMVIWKGINSKVFTTPLSRKDMFLLLDSLSQRQEACCWELKIPEWLRKQ